MLKNNKSRRLGNPYNGNQQSGMTAIAIAIILMVLGFFLLLILTLFPLYMENYKVSSHLNNLGDETGIAKMSDNKIIETLFRRFEIDDIENVKKDDVLIEEDDSGMTITIEYEVRADVMANIDIIVSFTESVVIQ